MPLGWREIRNNALAFSKEWAKETSEDAEAKSFWDQFFEVFGLSRRRLATFEQPVKKADGSGGYIDLLWRGVLLVEHKSRGKDLDRAYRQATDYFVGLKDRDLPKYVLVSDFARFRLYDLDENTAVEFPLEELHKNVGLFGFIAGYQANRQGGPQEAVNIKAAEQLGKLHDQLKDSGYEGHQLELLLVRLLFCLFADDTGIFDQRNQFKEFLEQKTAEDGSDLGQNLHFLFQILNTSPARRQTNLSEVLAAFAYVNGRLFEETLPAPSFDREMRDTLLDACALDWSRISPAIFGSLFQSIMDVEARRNFGAHYTRESNILKALSTLFLDELMAELDSAGSNPKKLGDFQKKLARVRVLDPACGCGNFLVIAYRELRKLELEVLRRLHLAGASSKTFDVSSLVYVDVDQFYGIEIAEFPAQIAQVALWLTDHQLNQQVSEEFGHYFARLPLKKSANIVHGNALRMRWEDFIPPSELSYIVGNPPFSGANKMNAIQKADVDLVFPGAKKSGLLDYVCCWYLMAIRYIQGTDIRVAFVSTNSISQGEQVGALWPDLLAQGLKISFAHRTFEWTSEAKGKAAVHCIIVGFGLRELKEKLLFEYDKLKGEPHVSRVQNINPYLVDAPDVVVTSRMAPICQVPELAYGSMPNDGGGLLLESTEAAALTDEAAKSFLRSFLGAEEFINGKPRYCLWLKGASPEKIRSSSELLRRLEAVRATRLRSTRETTRKLAAFPALFGEDRQPSVAYLAIPKTSSERRTYIPMGFLEPDVIASTELFTLAGGSLYHLGVLTSEMHMAWVRSVCGRLKSDYRYSATVVYNNFPWPDSTNPQRDAIVAATRAVLDVRASHATATLEDLYDPLAMPADLRLAHHKLDRAVDAAYGKKHFHSEAQRVAFLFDRYVKICAPLVVAIDKAKAKQRRQNTKFAVQQ